MKKKIFALALMAVSLVALPSMAKDNNTGCTKTEKCTKGKDKDCSKGRPCAFDKLNITDTQKAQLKDLTTKYRAEGKASAKQAKAQRHAADSVARDARRQAKAQYLQDIKAIVGPEQYVVFLENFYLDTPNKAQVAKGHKNFKGEKSKMQKDRKDRKDKMHKGQRPDKQ